MILSNESPRSDIATAHDRWIVAEGFSALGRLQRPARSGTAALENLEEGATGDDVLNWFRGATCEQVVAVRAEPSVTPA